jgi:hypothetical protein
VSHRRSGHLNTIPTPEEGLVTFKVCKQTWPYKIGVFLKLAKHGSDKELTIDREAGKLLNALL